MPEWQITALPTGEIVFRNREALERFIDSIFGKAVDGVIEDVFHGKPGTPTPVGVISETGEGEGGS